MSGPAAEIPPRSGAAPAGMRVIHFATTSLMHKAFVLPLARYQREQGFTVEFGCGEDLPSGYASAVPELEAAGFTVHVVPFPYRIRPVRDVAALVRLWRFFRRHRFAVVHTYTSKAGVLVRIAARLAGQPAILHAAYDFHFRKFPRGLRRTTFVWLERVAMWFTDLLLCSAEAIRDEAVRARIAPPSRIRLVGGPVGDLERFAVVPRDVEALRAELGLAADARVVACVCRLVEYKGVDTLLRAAQRVIQVAPDVRFVVMGGGPMEAELLRLAESLGVAGAVTFTGFRQDDRDVVRLLALARVFCLPTRREGYGVAFAEAMAMGCPVIGPRMEPVSGIVTSEQTGLLVTPEDDAAYAQALLRVLGDPELRDRLGAAGRGHVRSSLDPRTMYEAVTTIYRSLAEPA